MNLNEIYNYLTSKAYNEYVDGYHITREDGYFLVSSSEFEEDYILRITLDRDHLELELDHGIMELDEIENDFKHFWRKGEVIDMDNQILFDMQGVIESDPTLDHKDFDGSFNESDIDKQFIDNRITKHILDL